MLSPTATTESLTDMDDYFFRVTSTTRNYASKGAGFLFKSGRMHRVAAAYDLNNRSHPDTRRMSLLTVAYWMKLSILSKNRFRCRTWPPRSAKHWNKNWANSQNPNSSHEPDGYKRVTGPFDRKTRNGCFGEVFSCSLGLDPLVHRPQHPDLHHHDGVDEKKVGKRLPILPPFLRCGSLSKSDVFVVSGIHRIIRHPWYLGGMMIVWMQDLSVSTILINIIISIYFIVGAFLEERKLVREFGEKYRQYQQSVSMFFPRRWLKAKIVPGWKR